MQPLTNPQLEKMRSVVEKAVPPEAQEGYTQLINAGLSLLFSDQTHEDVRKKLSDIQKRGFQPKDIAAAMVYVVIGIAQQSGGQAKTQMLYPALVTLTAYALQYMEDTAGLKITPELIAQVTGALRPTLRKAMELMQQGTQGNAPTPQSQPPQAPSQPGVLSQPSPPQGAA